MRKDRLCTLPFRKCCASLGSICSQEPGSLSHKEVFQHRGVSGMPECMTLYLMKPLHTGDGLARPQEGF